MSLAIAFDLYDAAEAIMRQNLKRDFPDEDDAAIERRLVAWLLERPGAVDGDMLGRVRPWPPNKP